LITLPRPALSGAVVACAVSLAATAATQDPRTTFGVTTRLVQVNVIVHDKDGQPVADLAAGDFRLYEDGKEQAIESFSVESTIAAVARESPASRGDFGNRLRGPAGGGVTVILLDRLNTRFEDQTLARAQIVRFLGRLQPQDRVALYILESDSVHVLHDFTTDSSALLRAVARQRGTTSREMEAAELAPYETGEADIDAFVAREFAEVSAAALAERVTSTTRALEAIAHHLAGVQGRKNLIWISSGFPLVIEDRGPRPVTDQVDRATRAVNDANVAVYPVDARGLVGAFAGNPSALSSTSTRNTDQALRNVFTTMSTTRPNIEALQTIAENTGGRAFYETNDITRALSRAVDDSRVTYVLGYSPSQGKWDGSFHKIEVTVRRPGVEVRHRKGYLALPAPRLDPTKRQAALLDAVRSGLEATGIGLTAHVEKGAAPGQLDVALRLDPASVALQKVGERWEGAFDLAIMQGLAGGSLFPSLETTVELRLTDDLRARMLKQGLVVNRKVPLRDDALALHIAARDSTTGATGSLIIPAGRLRDATAQ
jgi:VWFA-related protein